MSTFISYNHEKYYNYAMTQVCCLLTTKSRWTTNDHVLRSLFSAGLFSSRDMWRVTILAFSICTPDYHYDHHHHHYYHHHHHTSNSNSNFNTYISHKNGQRHRIPGYSTIDLCHCQVHHHHLVHLVGYLYNK